MTQTLSQEMSWVETGAMSRTTDPAAALLQICMRLRASQALFVAAQLGVADYLAEQTIAVPELAAATQTHPGALRRLLRALAALGIFADQGDDTFSLTSVGQRLRRDHPRLKRRGLPPA